MWLTRSVADVRLGLITLVVDDYDSAIEFFVNVLGFDLVEDSPSQSERGQPKRWVVVRPAGAQTGIVLARADGPNQLAVVGNRAGGRVAFFLQVDDFDEAYERIVSAGVRIVREQRSESCGRVAVFLDCMGNSWDLLGPP